MIRLHLYGTPGCHLCEEAEQLLVDAAAFAPSVAWRTIDIAGDEELLQRYGERIPVLRFENSGAELNWPFQAIDLDGFLASIEQDWL